MSNEDQFVSGENETTEEMDSASPETGKSPIDEELERYGVWVKVEPQDLDDSGTEEDLAVESLEGDEEIQDAALTEEEEQLLGDLESDVPDVAVSAPDVQIEDTELSDQTAEELTLPEMDDSLEAELSDASVEEIQDVELDDLSIDSGETPEISAEETEALEIASESEVSAEVDVLAESDEAPLAEQTKEDVDTDLPEINIEEELPEIEDLSDLDDFSEKSAGDEAPPEIEELAAEPAAGDQEIAESDQVLPGAEEELDSFDMDELAQSDFGEELTELESEKDLSNIDDTGIAEEGPAEGGLSVEEELMSQEKANSPSASETPEILHNIESELKAIKEELYALKQELSSLKSIPVEVGAETQEPVAEPEGESGFFEDEDDETIALTGDELDNILNTADITEETAEATETPDDADLLEMDDMTEEKLVDQEDIIPLASDGEVLTAEDDVELDIADVPVDSQLDEETDIEIDEIEDAADAPVSDLEAEALVSTEGGEIGPELEELDLSETESIDIEEAETLDIEEADTEEPDLGEIDLADSEALDLGEPGPELDIAEEEAVELADDLTGSEESELELEEIEEIGDADELGSIDLDIEEAGLEDEGVDPLVEEVILKDTAEAEPHMEEAEELIAEELGDSRGGEVTTESTSDAAGRADIPEDLKSELKSVLQYMDHLLESLPEEKIQEFAQSEHFEVYKKLFEQLGLEE